VAVNHIHPERHLTGIISVSNWEQVTSSWVQYTVGSYYFDISLYTELMKLIVLIHFCLFNCWACL
jgi:hypothetical protein